jgi:hypothetical protein
LADYLEQTTSVCREFGLDRPEPARFFEEVVTNLSPYGHVASFDSAQDTADLFQEAGFRRIQAFVAFTPWLFPTRDSALWFVHELLGIGQACRNESDLTAQERAVFERGVSDYLGLRGFPDGSWAVPWKLMYVVGDRP